MAASSSHHKVAHVLQLVLEHAPTSPRSLCSLLCVSHSVRQAVKQSRARCTLHMPSFTATPAALANFAASCSWLPAHIGLVAQLHINGISTAPASSLDTAAQLLGLALSACATRAGAAAVAAGAAGALTAAAAPLQLDSVTAHNVVTPLLLRSLATCSTLTHLELSLRNHQTTSPALFAALGQLHSLRRLKFTSVIADKTCAEGISCLTRLTELELSHRAMTQAAMQALPSSLQSVTLRLNLPRHVLGLPVNISHLCALQKLDLLLPPHCCLRADSQLPHITALTVQGGVQAPQRGPQGSKLEQLHLLNAKEALPYLQHSMSAPRLRALALGIGGCAESDLRAVLAAAQPVAKQLTSLNIMDSPGSNTGLPRRPLDLGAVQLHPCLLQMTALQDLGIRRVAIQPADAIQLTALTSLTALRLRNCPHLGDVAAAALASRLAGSLQVLELVDCGLSSPVLWPAIGLCTALEALRIDSAPTLVMPPLDDVGLSLLTGLTRLTSLTGLGLQLQVSHAAYQLFKAAMPGLVRLPGRL